MGILDPKPPTRAELTATYVPQWKANTNYPAGQPVVTPAGDVVTAKAAFTSGATYDGANWNASAGMAGKLDKTDAVPLAFFGGFVNRMNGSLTIGFGDSHTAPAELTARRPYWEIAAVLSDQKLARYANAGVSGNTVEQMLARIDTDVIKKRPDRVIFLAGTNNMAGDINAAWTTYKTILDKLTVAGIGVALVSIPPRTTTQAIRDNTAIWNGWIKSEADRRGMPYINIHTPLSDGNGNFQAAYTTDGTHMTDSGALLAAQTVWNVLKYVWPTTSPVKLFTGADAAALATNPTFVDSNADGLPDNWTLSGNGTVGTVSIVTDPTVSGNVMRLNRTASSGILSARVPLSGRTPGETLEFAVKFRANSSAVTYNFYCTASDTNYNLMANERVLVDWTQNLGGFYTAYGRVTLPDTAVRAELVLQTSAGVGSVDWAQATWRSLTATPVPAQQAVTLVTTTSEPSLVLNPLLADANADSTPDNWVISGNATKAIGTDAAVSGNYLALTRTDTTTACNVSQDVTWSFAVGDVIELGAKYSLDTAGHVVYIYANCMDSTGASLLVTRAVNGESAITTGFKTGTARFTVPAGTTKIQFRFQSASGSGTVKFAQATMRKAA